MQKRTEKRKNMVVALFARMESGHSRGVLGKLSAVLEQFQCSSTTKSTRSTINHSHILAFIQNDRRSTVLLFVSLSAPLSTHTPAVSRPYAAVSPTTFDPSTDPRTCTAAAKCSHHHTREEGSSTDCSEEKESKEDVACHRSEAGDEIHFSGCDEVLCRVTYASSGPKYLQHVPYRYLRAAEVGRGAASSKYEIAIRLRTPRDSRLVRGRINLPHPVSAGSRIAVICAPDSAQARAAIDAGASLVGEETIIDAVKQGRIEFDKCLCHVDSLDKLNKSGVARILGPRGLMPSKKMNTVVDNVGTAVKFSGGASTYKETMGVIRMGIGQLGFTPDELSKNITAFTTRIRRDIAELSYLVTKDIHEVVLSSTNGPGFTLSGQVRAEGGMDPKDLSVVN